MMRRECVWLVSAFLIIWGGITLTINSANAFHFRLQNATIAALVERQTFTLKELDVPDFRLIVGQETFRISEDIYPMKQPGQTILGALIYWPLYKLGITYLDHYMYVSQLITMYSSALLTAMASMLIGWVGWQVSKSIKIGIITAFLMVFGTIIWPYSGVTHHDIYGMFLISTAITLYYKSNRSEKLIYSFLASVVASLSLFFTMLTFPLPFVLWGLQRNRILNGLGTMIGLFPTLIFNFMIFGKPWLVANIAGNVADTVPLLSITNFLEKIWFYLGNPNSALWAYSPIVIIGLWGILSLTGDDKWLKRLLIIPSLAQVLFVSTLETFGGHQYGPRYLLPIIPLLIIGVAIWLRKTRSSYEYLLFGSIVLFSLLIAGVGAVQSVMVPIGDGYEPYKLLLKTLAGDIGVMRVWKYGMAMIGMGILLLIGGKLTKPRFPTKRE